MFSEKHVVIRMKINKDIIAKKLFRSKWLLCFLTCLFFVGANAQDIPQHISYSRVYDFIDELAIDKVIDINSVSKPYSRNFIAQKLAEAQTKKRSIWLLFNLRFSIAINTSNAD